MKSNKKSTPKPAETLRNTAWTLQPWHMLLAVFGVILVLFEVYGPALHGPFVFDDNYLAYGLPGFAERAPLIDWLRGNRPLLMLTFWLNYHVFGPGPYSYHVVNVFLHFATSCLIAFCAWNILKKYGMEEEARYWMSGFAGAVFLLHPLQSETVAYVASRSDGLSVLLFFLAFALFLNRRRDEIGFVDSACVLILFGAACMVKEHAVVLPALLLLTDYYFNPPFSLAGARKNWRLYVPIVVIGALGAALIYHFTLARSDSAGFSFKDFTWYQYFFTQCRALWFYMLLFVAPVGQNLDYDFPISYSVFEHGAIFFLAGLLGLVYVAWRYRREYPLASYGFFAFLILMAPTSSFIPIKDPFVERRLYLPMFGLLMIAIEFVRRLKLTKPALGASMAVLLLLYCIAARSRNQVWSSSVALWTDTVSKSPNKVRPHLQLAYAYQYEQGNCPGAVSQYAIAANLEPPDYRALVDSALASDCAGNTDAAVQQLERAAKLESTAHVYSQLGMMLAKEHRMEEALQALDRAEKLDPAFGMTYAYRGNIFLSREDRPKAIEQYQRALRIDNSNELAQRGLAQAQATPSTK
jgi:Tfp pilus assembly protein PilF